MALFGNQASKFQVEELEIARQKRLPMLWFVKRLPDATSALPDWLTSIDAPIYPMFENTTELRAQLLTSLARLREKLLHDAEAREAAKPPEAAPLRTVANDESKAAPQDQAAPAPGAPPARDAEAAQPASTNPEAPPVPGRLRRTADWAKRNAGRLFALGVMAVVSYFWWSNSRIETPAGQTTSALDTTQAEPRQLDASFGPVDYQNAFVDLLRGVPTTSGTALGPMMLIFRPGNTRVGTDPRNLNAMLSLSPKIESDEQPAHEVRITRPLAIGMHKISVRDYTLFAFATGRPMPLGAAATNGANADPLPEIDGIPSDGRDRYPVQNVSWDVATVYVGWLSSVSGARYRLPTEAEWESVARSYSRGAPDDYWT